MYKDTDLTAGQSLGLLQDGPWSDLRCFLHELAVKNSCFAQHVTFPNFLLDHLTKIRQSYRSSTGL